MSNKTIDVEKAVFCRNADLAFPFFFSCFSAFKKCYREKEGKKPFFFFALFACLLYCSGKVFQLFFFTTTQKAKK